MSHLNQILNRYASERVTLRQTEKTKAKGFCRPIVEGIVEYVSKDTLFAGMEIQGNGSYYERCKVGEPNEFDFMLVIKGLELDGVYEYDGMSEPPIGFTRIMMGNGRWLSASGLKSVFANLVRRAIKELKYEGFVKVSSHGPAVKLLILTNYRDGKKYCVDLVPAIKDNTWPGDAIEWIQRQRKSTRKRSLLFQSARPKGVKMDNSSLVFLNFRRFYLVFMDN